MQDDSQNIYKVIDNLTLPDYEIPAGKTDEYFKQFGVFEDVLGSYSPGKHLTQVKVSTPFCCIAVSCTTSL